MVIKKVSFMGLRIVRLKIDRKQEDIERISSLVWKKVPVSVERCEHGTNELL